MVEHDPEQHQRLPAELAPGAIIELADITQLHAFEDMIAPLVDPDYNPELWEARSKLKDLLRPPKFNGSFKNCTLTVMAEPYARLLDARERGWRLGNNSPLKRTSKRGIEQQEQYLGFVFAAEAHSTGYGCRGLIESEVWYAPMPLHFAAAAGSYGTKSHRLASGEKKDYPYTQRKDYISSSAGVEGTAIRRFVARPKFEEAAFRRLDATSRRIGFQVLQRAMMHPIVSPHRS